MIKLFSKEEFDEAKSSKLLPLKCNFCGKTFYKEKKEIKYAEKPGKENRCRFCSQACATRYVRETIKYPCDNCGKEILLPRHLYKNSNKHHFCSKSCSATYNNKHKNFGTRVSKLEAFLRNKIVDEFPDLNILFNDKATIGSELDILIPEIKIAFEINGIIHYEPIYGE